MELRLENDTVDVVANLAAAGTVPLTPGTAVANPGRWFVAVVTAAGNVAVKFADGTTGVYPFPTGLTYLPIGVVEVLTPGTTATGTYSNWQ